MLKPSTVSIPFLCFIAHNDLLDGKIFTPHCARSFKKVASHFCSIFTSYCYLPRTWKLCQAASNGALEGNLWIVLIWWYCLGKLRLLSLILNSKSINGLEILLVLTLGFSRICFPSRLLKQNLSLHDKTFQGISSWVEYSYLYKISEKEKKNNNYYMWKRPIMQDAPIPCWLGILSGIYVACVN